MEDRNYEVMVPPEKEPKPQGFTYTWAGERLGYLRGSVAAVVLGHRNASKEMMFQIQDRIGWKVTDQVRFADPASKLVTHGKRLWEVMRKVYEVEKPGSPVKGSTQCLVCGVWNIGVKDPSCWNCGEPRGV